MKEADHISEFVQTKAALIFLKTDKDWIIKQANKYAENLFGKSLTDRPILELVVDLSESLNMDLFVDEPDKKHMLSVNTASGLPQTYYFTFRNVNDGVLVFGESNTIEVEELRNSFLQLNQDLNNLTRELQKKNVQLKKLNDQKNEFIGMAAHDLRNPIAVIMGYSEFILDEAEGRLEPAHVEFIRTILSSSEFMLKMLNDLLDIAKIESGKLNLNKTWSKPEKLINSNVSRNRVIASKKGIKMVVEIFENLPQVYIDPDKIEQVLNNLISNAIKFSNSGTTITISAFNSKHEITVAVKDQGQGIPKEDQAKLFKPFSRLSVKPTDGEHSTGLGLTITKKIILGHGGKIWVESLENAGTTFYFTLPLNEKVQ